MLVLDHVNSSTITASKKKQSLNFLLKSYARNDCPSLLLSLRRLFFPCSRSYVLAETKLKPCIAFAFSRKLLLILRAVNNSAVAKAEICWSMCEHLARNDR